MNEDTKQMTPLKAIRAKCLECCCGHPKDVKHCEFTKCTLYHYRLGKDMKRKGKVNSGSFKPKITACAV